MAEKEMSFTHSIMFHYFSNCSQAHTMSKWQDNQKKSSFDWRKKVSALIQAKTAELQKLTESERHRLENLQGLLRQLKRANTFYSLF